MWMFIQMLIFYAFRQIDGQIHRQLDRQIDLSSIPGWQKSLKFPCSSLLRSKELLTFEDLSFVKPEELNETRNSWIGVAEEDMSLNVGGHNTEIIQYYTYIYIYMCVIHICNVFTYIYIYIYTRRSSNHQKVASKTLQVFTMFVGCYCLHFLNCYR